MAESKGYSNVYMDVYLYVTWGVLLFFVVVTCGVTLGKCHKNGDYPTLLYILYIAHISQFLNPNAKQIGYIFSREILLYCTLRTSSKWIRMTVTDNSKKKRKKRRMKRSQVAH